MEKGIAHEVHYWIDSNTGAEHREAAIPRRSITSVEFFSPSNDVDLTVSHNPALTEEVCDTFD